MSSGIGRARAIWAALLLAGAGSATAADAPPQQEHLVVFRPLGFVVDYEFHDERQSLIEEIPVGEISENWTRLITTRSIRGMARVHPAFFVEGVARDVFGKCPGGTMRPLDPLLRNGRDAAKIRVECPQHPQTGQPEIFFLMAVAGEVDLHIKQVRMRRAPTEANIRWGESVLQRVRYCSAADTSEPCTRTEVTNRPD